MQKSGVGNDPKSYGEFENVIRDIEKFRKLKSMVFETEEAQNEMNKIEERLLLDLKWIESNNNSILKALMWLLLKILAVILGVLISLIAVFSLPMIVKIICVFFTLYFVACTKESYESIKTIQEAQRSLKKLKEEIEIVDSHIIFKK